MKKHFVCLVVLALGLTFGGCDKIDPLQKTIQLDVPSHFSDPPIPEDNPITQAKIDLGKKLFYDPLLSKDSSLNCSSCHLPENAFADPRATSLGFDDRTGTRNAPALINVVYGRSFFWDGSNPRLETQAIFPIEAENEMNHQMGDLLERLKAHPTYPDEFAFAFPDDDEPVSTKTITYALATFERTLLSTNSKFDRYMQGDSSALNASEKRGLLLFNGERAECFHCHGGFNFTDEQFHSNGLYEVYEDQGRWEVTGEDRDVGKFKTPTLRNIEHTAPYMHDGSINTLEEVVAHYMSGGAIHRNKSVLIREFALSEQEKQDLINFLKALSDEDFLNNPDLLPE